MRVLLFLLFLLIPIALVAQLREFTSSTIATPETPVVQANAKYPNNALMLIYSDLEGLQFRSSVGAINQQNYNAIAGRYEVLCKPLKQMVFVAKPGFMEHRVATINPEPKAVLYYEVAAKKEQLARKELIPVKISSNPEMCDLWINGVRSAGSTPFSGEVMSGQVQIRLEKEHYNRLDTSISLTSKEDLELRFNLEPHTGIVELETTPIGAEVFVDNQPLGYTPISLELPVGSHALRLELRDYLAVASTLEISKDNRTDVHYKLTSLDAQKCIDIDGNKYKVVDIGRARWMAENLRVTRFSNGDLIPEIIDDYNWDEPKPRRCTYEGKNRMWNRYGALYNWHVVTDERNVCPVGWRVPTDKDWTALARELDHNATLPTVSVRRVGDSDVQSYSAGGALKKKGGGWIQPNIDASNRSKFSGLPGGYRHHRGYFEHESEIGYWWSYTATGEKEALIRSLAYDSGNLFRTMRDIQNGYSIRCIQDKIE